MINQQLDKNIQLFYTKESIEANINSMKFFEYYTTCRIWNNHMKHLDRKYEEKYGEKVQDDDSPWFWELIDEKRYEEAAKQFLDLIYGWAWLEENPDAKYSKKETDEILTKYLIEIYEDVELTTESGGQAGDNGFDVKVFED